MGIESLFAKIGSICKSPIVYIRSEPTIYDFTQKFNGDIVISSKEDEIRLTLDRSNIDLFANFIRQIAENSKCTLLTWDFKSLVSYIYFHCSKPKSLLSSRFIDLKYGSMYLGNRNTKQPINFNEAIQLIKNFVGCEQWKQVNQLIFNPLASHVLPNLETKGILDLSIPDVVYSKYEIEGSVNGRMTTSKPSSKFLTVHSMSDTQKVHLFPRRISENAECFFLVFDYSHMEVSILQWLTGDEYLGEILSCKGDFYQLIYEDVFNEPCTTQEQRTTGKNIFLPVVFGLQASPLADRLKIPFSQAETVIATLKSKFEKTFKWLEQQEEVLQTSNIVTDCFGRRRDFTGVPKYKIRNFQIQSPAALICLEKLCHIHRELANNILFHIHDGYIMFSKKRDVKDIVQSAKSILISDSQFCPGLKLRVKCHVGQNLTSLKTINLT